MLGSHGFFLYNGENILKFIKRVSTYFVLSEGLSLLLNKPINCCGLPMVVPRNQWTGVFFINRREHFFLKYFAWCINKFILMHATFSSIKFFLLSSSKIRYSLSILLTLKRPVLIKIFFYKISL